MKHSEDIFLNASVCTISASLNMEKWRESFFFFNNRYVSQLQRQMVQHDVSRKKTPRNDNDTERRA